MLLGFCLFEILYKQVYYTLYRGYYIRETKGKMIITRKYLYIYFWGGGVHNLCTRVMVKGRLLTYLIIICLLKYSTPKIV